MIHLHIHSGDLLKWSRFTDEISKETPAALARALNAVGEDVVRTASDYISRQSGLEPSVVRDMIQVDEATPGHLVWEMDASSVAPPSQDWSRPWERSTDKSFDQQSLVTVITREDEKVCPICEAAKENGPYTLEEAQKLFSHGANGEAGIHPRCRCLIGPWQSRRKIPVVFGSAGAAPTMFTTRQLGEAVSKELRTIITAVK